MLIRSLTTRLALALVTASALASSPWSVAKSQHFEIYSQAGSEHARLTLLQFEQLRAAFTQIPLLGSAGQRMLRVVEFTNLKDYEAVRVQSVGDAFYTGSEDTDYIAMPIGPHDDAAIAAHEYAHFILHANDRKLFPWLSEGLAEYCSTVRISGNQFQIGGTIPSRAQTLAHPGQNERAVFYAESWAVVDMLLSRNDPNLPETPPNPALLNEARAWVRAGASAVKTIPLPPAPNPITTVESLPDQALQFLLADLHSMNGDKEGAEALYHPRHGCTDAQLCYRYALLSDRLNHPAAEIEESLTKAVALDPTFDRARFRLAQIKSNTGDYQSAVDHLQALTHVPATHAYGYWTALAYGLAELGRNQEAIAAAEHARKEALDPDQITRAENLAYIAGTKLTVRYSRDAQGNRQLVTARIPYTTADRNPFIEETDRIQTASGELKEVQCAHGALTGLLVRTDSATLALSVTDPTHVLIRHGQSEWTCGPQPAPAKVAVEFAGNQLRGIDFQQ